MPCGTCTSNLISVDGREGLRRIVTAVCVPLLAAAGLACSGGDSPSSGVCEIGEPGAVPISVTAESRIYRDRPVVASLGAIELPSEVSSWDEAAVRLFEIGADGSVRDSAVPVQLDVLPGEAAAGDSVQLVFSLEEQTDRGETRSYRLCVSHESSDVSGATSEDRVRLEGTEMHEGQESLVLRTDSAAYYYHRRGAGFASLHDVDGNDWLSYNPGVGEESGSGSGGRYRGMPNTGYPEGYAHPGEDTSRTEIVGDGPLRVSMYSVSSDGKMRIRWDIYPEFARLTVIEMRPPYWFLYEGTPGGKLDLDTDYWVRSGDEPGTRLPASEEWTQDLAEDAGGEWAYVEDGALGRILVLAHHEDDDGVDSYWPMNEEMTVFGFGRRDLEKFMTETPNQFTVGFLEKRSPARLLERVRSFYDEPRITVGAGG